MASGIFALLDDVATLMDDVAAMSKVAAKKTAGILGDDLAVNAEKASGFVSDREIPVLWAITKGSLLNKVIILPLAFLLSAFVPIAVTIILIMGGLYLAYEGAEKIHEYLFPHEKKPVTPIEVNLTKAQVIAKEKEKIKSAVFTDFILSVEIIIIALGTVVGEPILEQILVVTFIALLATVGVYGIVAIIIRMDEFGYKLIALNEEKDSFSDKVGLILVNALPKIIKGMGVVGTIALILVSGGIFVHNIDYFHHLFPGIPSIIKEIVLGLLIGFLVLGVVSVFKKIWKPKTKSHE
ncbi:DUF808 domain-containing protein [Algoriphagus halophytocola]|uniref:DUF808 domain-containing protein n=1 Tax=Algoriphagus halophytocola TaxID=2991499 RepID=A0ABY6MIU9_9BACT|nr:MULTISPECIES: DUF808 domain-containing protein [unclassified Algoriphagus]UZD22591.1 DUF808 domain-containing protein [Algoriphagus sp. TR-M5]WBL43857.1 DUF808 domain-containing protein [Algoriphagus sp. TR-M9]